MTRPWCVLIVVCSLGLSPAVAAHAAAGQLTERSVYVTVVDKDGAPVTGLTAADFTLKEGGRDREITAVSPPTARMKLAVLVEESLVADTNVRVGLFEFAQRMVPQADVALVLVGLRNVVVVDYTTDLNAIVEGINGFPLGQHPSAEHMAEGIYDQARLFEQSDSERPAIVGIALETMQASSERPQRVFDQLRKSGAVLHVVTVSTGYATAALGDLADLAERSKIFGEGAKQSGGERIEVSSTPGIPRALQQVANSLWGQFLITYVLPDGTEPSDRLSVTTKRDGLSVRAPSRIPD